jgi:hypothetical protein
MSHIPKKNPDIIWKNLKGETVLLNPATGSYYGLNRVGCSFWEKADGSRSMAEIEALMFQEFEVEKERLSRDLADLIKSLSEKGLVTLSAQA